MVQKAENQSKIKMQPPVKAPGAVPRAVPGATTREREQPGRDLFSRWDLLHPSAAQNADLGSAGRGGLEVHPSENSRSATGAFLKQN